MPITELPIPPSRMSPTTFSARADAFLGALPGFVAEANALGEEVATNTATVAADKSTTIAARDATIVAAADAAAAVIAAAAIAGAAKWVSGNVYAIGDCAWSPLDSVTYRRLTNGAGVTDPSADAANWAATIYTREEALAALALKADLTYVDSHAPLASPALTGTPTAPTAAPGTNTTQLATAAFVQTAIAALVASSPAALDTLNELAAALGNDANFATTTTNSLAGKISHSLATAANDMLVASGSGVFVKKTLAEIKTILGLSDILPAGTVIYVAMASSPAGYLKCNGAAISRATYAALFAAIGTVYGVGDGSTTFNVPDLRGEFIRSWADNGSLDAGRALGSLQADEIRSHKHYIDGSSGVGALAGVWAYDERGSSILTENANETKTTGGAETRPSNIALLACIKY